ncbi:ParB/RepB/Spo0J family partition protein [Silicimonas algicola]|uniref:Chromosome segregation DNA-binding protein n=1 Tax=Silicimonas algicola TaxID=1826607 RepID=A0A316G7B1_9RHOB|nr:ParB/RepB/Spo0J family partition protein [Silicimonas algicola]AZQ69445.1 ParB/RepB/Spo0J family partition protein [Silicimonas algicola]PWK56512.1 chromosome segregation DNA-binding protein [Silicimonas algicola]
MAQAKVERRGLGRGLSALMADVEAPSAAGSSGSRKAEATVAIDRILPNPDQPRRTFTEDALEELTTSIREKGIIQPLILRPDPRNPGGYQIVAGERRWRAAQRARLHEVPAIVRELDDTEVLELAIIENIQRADLNAVEEAAGYRQLMDRFGHTQEKLAEAMGKSRSHIANLLRMLNLPDEVLSFVREGTLSAGHARALVTAEDPVTLARQIAKSSLSVRQAERLAKGSGSKAKGVANRTEKDADTRQIERDLAAALGMKVTIDHAAGTENGTLTIRYRDLTELDEVCRRLSVTTGAGEV